MKTVKVEIMIDEKWPVYEITSPEEGIDPNVEIPEEIYKDYLRISVEYSRMQTILKAYHDTIPDKCSMYGKDSGVYICQD